MFIRVHPWFFSLSRPAAALWLFLTLLSVARVAHADDPDPAANVVEIFCTFQEYDPFLPWKTQPPSTKHGYGCLVGDSRVLTTENLVRNARLVELRRPRSADKIAATVELSDCQTDLAILRAGDSGEFANAPPIELASKPAKGDSIEILQFDETQQIQRGKASVVNISVAELPTAPYPALQFSMLAELSINGEGAVAVHEGKLAGIVVAFDPGTRIARLLPYPILTRFLADASATPYKGVASAGLIWNPLVNPARRKHLGIPQNGKGFLVTCCIPDTGAAESLRKDDVIMEWDGSPIDNMGFYEDETFGHLGFSYLIRGKRKPGDSVPVKLIRGGGEQTVTVRLDRWQDGFALIPDDVIGEQAEYFVEGGIIIREVTGRYLRAHGADWQISADARLVHSYLSQNEDSREPGDRIVIVAGVLPDPINIGYQQMQDEIVTKVNGKPIRNIGDVFRIAESDGCVERISFLSAGVDTVLDRNELPAANARISELYRIPSLRYKRKPPP